MLKHERAAGRRIWGMLMRTVKDSAEGVGVKPKDKKDRQTESGDLI
jgi:hypothetical protein